jgi:hypothetical protein
MKEHLTQPAPASQIRRKKNDTDDEDDDDESDDEAYEAATSRFDESEVSLAAH